MDPFFPNPSYRCKRSSIVLSENTVTKQVQADASENLSPALQISTYVQVLLVHVGDYIRVPHSVNGSKFSRF